MPASSSSAMRSRAKSLPCSAFFCVVLRRAARSRRARRASLRASRRATSARGRIARTCATQRYRRATSSPRGALELGRRARHEHLRRRGGVAGHGAVAAPPGRARLGAEPEHAPRARSRRRATHLGAVGEVVGAAVAEDDDGGAPIDARGVALLEGAKHAAVVGVVREAHDARRRRPSPMRRATRLARRRGASSRRARSRRRRSACRRRAPARRTRTRA